MLIWLYRQKLSGPLYAALASGFIGGIGFSSAALLKMLAFKTGIDTNYHSLLEQSYGWINGIGMAVAFVLIIRHAPSSQVEEQEDRPVNYFMIAFLLLWLTYMNMQRLPEDWIKHKVFQEQMYGLSTFYWFDIGYFAIAATVIGLLWLHYRRPLPLLPIDLLGRAQLMFLVLLWWIVLGNLLDQVASWSFGRLITEGFIHLHALFCSVLAVLAPMYVRGEHESVNMSKSLKQVWMLGGAAIVLVPILQFGITRLVYGGRIVEGNKAQIRFGPNATAVDTKPKKGVAHP